MSEPKDSKWCWTPAKKAVVLFLSAISLVIFLLKRSGPSVGENNQLMKTNSLTSPVFDSPEHAVESLLLAYQKGDVDAIVAAKDFATDSRMFWEDLGLALSAEKQADSVVAFEANFRKQLDQDGVPDYHDVKYTLTRQTLVQSNFAIVVFDCLWPDGRRSKLNLSTFNTGAEWKAVLAPGYDHL